MSTTGEPSLPSAPIPQGNNANPLGTSPGPSSRSNNNAPFIPATIRFGVGAAATATIRATQHQIPATGLGRGTPGFNVGGGVNGAGGPQTTNNNAGEMPQQTQNLFQMRDRLFLALFFRVSLIYARAFPKSLRRALEFCLLMQSILLLLILGYIHVVYTRTPITCLSEFKDSWPKNGILRVEITPDAGEDYDLTKSYGKEERLRQRAAASQFGHYTDDLLSIMLSADTLLLDRVVSTAGGLLATVTGGGSVSKTVTEVTKEDSKVVPTSSVEIEPPDSSSVASSSITASSTSSMLSSGEGQRGSSETSSVDPTIIDGSENQGHDKDISRKSDDLDGNLSNKSLELEEDSLAAAAEGEERTSDIETIAPSIPITASGEGSLGASSVGVGSSESLENIDVTNPDSLYFNKTLEEIEVIKMQQKQLEEDKLLNSSVTDFEMFANSVWLQEQAYIVEYALEYGFLRLSQETRQKLGIPVKLVTLDPGKATCFGDTFSLFLLENFLGYDDILMSSIKNLAESEENKGYLRNVVTGEQFRFVPMWMARSSYIPALLIMLVFTVSISMLLRYSHHQIFVFIVDLLNNIEGAGSIHIPAAPLFTVILALVGMEAIMSEFFNDTSTAFYVILIVWIADQFDSVCSHTNITKKYWVRFFYLYHFAFYAYHYRFNGQYGGLALLVSWSFIQHSMVYFYHHYELPAILRQAHQPLHLQTENPNNVTREGTGPSGEANGQPANPNSDAGTTQASPQSPPPTPPAPSSSAGSENDLTNDSNPTMGINNPSSSPSETNIINNAVSASINSEADLVSTSESAFTSPVPSRIFSPQEMQRDALLLQRQDGQEGLSSSSTRDFSSLSPEMTSAPTIFNDRNINIVNHNLDRRGDGMMRDNSTSGVNNNDCNPTRVGLGQSCESATSSTSASAPTSTSSPAQVLGCSSESQLNLRMDVVGDEDSTPLASAVNPRANNHIPATGRQDDGSMVETSCSQQQSSLRHRLPRGSVNGRDGVRTTTSLMTSPYEMEEVD